MLEGQLQSCEKTVRTLKRRSRASPSPDRAAKAPEISMEIAQMGVQLESRLFNVFTTKLINAVDKLGQLIKKQEQRIAAIDNDMKTRGGGYGGYRSSTVMSNEKPASYRPAYMHQQQVSA